MDLLDKFEDWIYYTQNAWLNAWLVRWRIWLAFLWWNWRTCLLVHTSAATIGPPLFHRCCTVARTVAPNIPRRLLWGCAKPALRFRIHVSLKVFWLLDATVGLSGYPSVGGPWTARMLSSHLSATIILLCHKETPSRFVGDSGNPVICLISCSPPWHVEASPSVWRWI